MWTPKRILLLVFGFVGFTLVYLVYSMTTLGRINTLPPLPERYQPNSTSTVEVRPFESTPSPLKVKLERAFGTDCKEKDWPVQLDLNARNMVIAAEDFKLEADGRVLLISMSVALFGKKKNDRRGVEINTLRCSRAYITFDRPVVSLTPGELNGRKIAEAELLGEGDKPIVIVNNRRTTKTDDDLKVTINRGPLYYQETKQIIRTNDLVHLRDGQTEQPKAKITAKGMVMALATTPAPAKPGQPINAKTKNDSISGVKQIVLKHDVDMELLVAGSTPFPKSDKHAEVNEIENPAAPVASKSAGKPPSHVFIRTPGRFQYDIFKDHDLARFDVPHDSGPVNSPQHVTVERIVRKDGGRDQLVCKHLEIRLKRRANETTSSPHALPQEGKEGRGKGSASPERDLQIETAHATGPYVTLTSDDEKLDAHGCDFFHDAAKKLSILKGAPFMEATKEDSLIQAPELRIQEVPLPSSAPAMSRPNKGKAAAKTFQRIQASGPGEIHILNKTTNKRTTHAFWKEQLISTKEGDKDLLVLTGEARFEDKEHDQGLQADLLKVWLWAEEKKPETATAKMKAASASVQPSSPGKSKEKSAAAIPQQSRRPYRIQALRNVKSHSRELIIHDTSRLLVRFTDVPADRLPPPKKKEKTSAPNSANGKRPPSAAAPSAKVPVASAPSAKVPVASAPPAKVPVASAPPTKAPSATAPATVAAPTAANGSRPPLAAKTPATPAPLLTAPGKSPQEPQDKARPIDMTARSIEAEVLRSGERSVLDHLWAEGSPLDGKSGVRVRQEPAKKGERGVYIEGNTLNMKCYPEGNVLDVGGDLAQLLMDKIIILGPDVHIDQKLNQASVQGEGAMQMESNQTLDGKPLWRLDELGNKVLDEHGKPLPRSVPLTVHWSDKMIFCGEHAEFYGGIQATQEHARLASQYLQVLFDKPISLKEGARSDQPAKVRSLDSDKDVRVEDSTYNKAGELQKYQLMSGSSLRMDTVPRDEDRYSSARRSSAASGREGRANEPAHKSGDANEVLLSASPLMPGVVRILQRGGSDLTVAPNQPARGGPIQRPIALPGWNEKKPQGADDQEMKLTYVRFERFMKASSRSNTATFWESVRVLNMPCNDPHMRIDLDAILAAGLPTGAMYMRCDHLKVHSYEKREIHGNKELVRSYQEMAADGKVSVKAKEFSARADKMTFDEAKDLVIFIGVNGRPAVLERRFVKGGRPDVLRGEKVFYIRSSGKAWAEKIESIDGK